MTVKLQGFFVFQAVRERESDWRYGAETDRALLRGGTIQRTQGMQVMPSSHFDMICHDPFIGMTVYASLKQRKADKHYTGLGGCSSRPRPEQSRRGQQVRNSRLQRFELHSVSLPLFSLYWGLTGVKVPLADHSWVWEKFETSHNGMSVDRRGILAKKKKSSHRAWKRGSDR